MANKQMTNKLIYWDGAKSSLLWDEATDAWVYHTNAPKTEVQDFYQAVPTIFRGVGKIAQAVGAMPFDIYGKGDTVIDTSQDYTNELGFLPNPGASFAIASQSLDLMGVSYFLKMANDANFMKELRYLTPRTITPVFNKKEGKLVEFERTVNNTQKTYKIEDILYSWLPDPYIELGEPQAYPVKAALRAAGVLSNLDDFVAVYFERGAVRPIIVSVKGVPKPEERERMEKWFTKLMGGIKNAFAWRIFNADTVDIKQVGDGLSELRDVELTEQRRQDVCVALGVPYNILFSEYANYATAKQDKLNFYEDQVVPRCEFIAESWNTQLFEPLGYRLDFKPETLDIFQEDENERADALLKFTQAGYNLLMASDILGVELTDDQRADLEAQAIAKEESRAAMLQLAQTSPKTPENEPEREDNKMLDEIDKWRRKSLNALKRGKSASVPFASDEIPLVVVGAIEGSLEEAQTNDDIKQIFANTWAGYP